MAMALHHTELQGPLLGVDEAATVQLTAIGLCRQVAELSEWPGRENTPVTKPGVRRSGLRPCGNPVCHIQVLRRWELQHGPRPDLLVTFPGVFVP